MPVQPCDPIPYLPDHAVAEPACLSTVSIVDSSARMEIFSPLLRTLIWPACFPVNRAHRARARTVPPLARANRALRSTAHWHRSCHVSVSRQGTLPASAEEPLLAIWARTVSPIHNALTRTPSPSVTVARHESLLSPALKSATRNSTDGICRAEQNCVVTR